MCTWHMDVLPEHAKTAVLRHGGRVGDLVLRSIGTAGCAGLR